MPLKTKYPCFHWEFKGELGDLTIHVELGKDTITISDRGIGLTAEEIEKYINQNSIFRC